MKHHLLENLKHPFFSRILLPFNKGLGGILLPIVALEFSTIFSENSTVIAYFPSKFRNYIFLVVTVIVSTLLNGNNAPSQEEDLPEVKEDTFSRFRR